MTTLCPSSKNELGKGTLRPDKEAELLAGGYVFAARVPGTRVGTLVMCKRPIAEAVTDANLDNPRSHDRKRAILESSILAG